MNLFISCSHLGYVNDEKELLFSMTLKEVEETMKYYKNKIPLPLSSQFKNKVIKEVAVQKKIGRNTMTSALFPPGKRDIFLKFCL